ncbi:Hypoxia induced protein domain [Trinorchestia longiramus]|nr:Hypoxia induced protein domain [Trinorchestia longiramus]
MQINGAIQFDQSTNETNATMSNDSANREAQTEFEKAAAELDWIVMHGYEDQPLQEGFREKTKKKIQENPFIPIGCIATAGILGMGLVNMMRGNKRNSQLLMRLRVASQGLTVAALLVGAIFNARKT